MVHGSDQQGGKELLFEEYDSRLGYGPFPNPGWGILYVREDRPGANIKSFSSEERRDEIYDRTLKTGIIKILYSREDVPVKSMLKVVFQGNGVKRIGDTNA